MLTVPANAACSCEQENVIGGSERTWWRSAETTQTTMVLGPGARENGGRCERIPDTLPGVGYVAEDGAADVTRVRAYHVTDTDIDHLAATYPPHQPREDQDGHLFEGGEPA